MKKFFIAISLLVAVAFLATPSYALVGIDDAVPGTNFIVPFIVVKATSKPSSGQDTSIVWQEVGGVATTNIHWRIYDPASNHLKDDTRALTAYDVDAISVNDIIWDYCSAANRTAMEVDIDGDGTTDHYAGYMTFFKDTNTGSSNLVAFFMYLDLAAGQSSGAYAGIREYAPAGQGFVAGQNTSRDSNGVATLKTYEVFTADAYATTYFRSRGVAVGTGVGTATSIRFTPRWYLHDANGESYFILWKSDAEATAAAGTVNINMWNTAEADISTSIILQQELTIYNVANDVRAIWKTSYASAGWLDITINATAGTTLTGWDDLEYLAYVWINASSSTASLNWSTLWADRQVGTM